MKKKVLIAKHEYSAIYKNITWDFEANNYEVFPLVYKVYTVNEYRSLKDRLVKAFRKTILKDNTYKQKLFLKYFEDDYLNQLKSYPNNHFDYSLVIRADFYTIPVIKEIIRVCKYNISYHWDGMERFPEIQTRVAFFDKFYVFEEKDFDKYSKKFVNLGLANNFYFENNKPVNSYPKTDVFYIGAYVENRNEDLLNLFSSLKKLSLNVKLMLCCENQLVIKKNENIGIDFFKDPIDYSETLEMSKSSKAILDFRIKGSVGHKGLSLRFFEALYHENKIITDNEEILKYDFYKPENIFILGKDNNEDFERFINSKYVKVDKTIVDKHSFINWFESKLPQ